MQPKVEEGRPSRGRRRRRGWRRRRGGGKADERGRCGNQGGSRVPAVAPATINFPFHIILALLELPFLQCNLFSNHFFYTFESLDSSHTKNRTMFEAKIVQGNMLKKVVEAMKDLVTEANLDCSEAGISLQVNFSDSLHCLQCSIAIDLQAMDSSHVSLVALYLKAEGFEKFRCDRSIALGLNLGILSKVITQSHCYHGSNDQHVSFRSSSVLVTMTVSPLRLRRRQMTSNWCSKTKVSILKPSQHSCPHPYGHETQAKTK